jgi:NADH-quinone oxidoreductase subunit L
VGSLSRLTRKWQTGFIYSYAASMVIGVLVLMTYWFSPLIFG